MRGRKRCPFCGAKPSKHFIPEEGNYYGCVHTSLMQSALWDTRPLEDELQAQIDTLKGMMDMNPSTVTTCMGKPFSYWSGLQRKVDTAAEMAKRVRKYVMTPHPDWREIMRYCEIVLEKLEEE